MSRKMNVRPVEDLIALISDGCEITRVRGAPTGHHMRVSYKTSSTVRFKVMVVRWIVPIELQPALIKKSRRFKRYINNITKENIQLHTILWEL